MNSARIFFGEAGRPKRWVTRSETSKRASRCLGRARHEERGGAHGHRSSRLGIQYRVIYRVVAQELQVLVIELTAHDYRRR